MSYGIDDVRGSTAKSGSTTSSSTTRTTTAATPSSASTSRCDSWSTPSRAPPRATASRSACCCCTARSAAARARSPGCSRRAWSATRRPTTARVYTLGWVDVEDTRRRALVPDARGAAAPDSRAVPRRRAAQLERGPRRGRLPGPDRRRALPLLPLHLHRPAEEVRRRLDARHPGRPRQAARSSASRTASASARSSPRTRRTRTRPS